jgi:uncharacterized protein (TIGR02118 family)
MIFRSGIFSRKHGISEHRFNQHWLRVHGELARHMPGVHRYLQNHIRERLFEVQPFPSHEVGGISQQWFDDIEAMERCERSPEYAAVKRDIPNFQGAITILVLQGEGSRDVAEGAAKLLVLWRSRGDGSVRSPHGAIAHVHNRVVDRAHPVSADVPSGRVPVDAMDELWFPSRVERRAWAASEAGRAFLHGQAHLEPLAVYAVEEIRIM